MNATRKPATGPATHAPPVFQATVTIPLDAVSLLEGHRGRGMRAMCRICGFSCTMTSEGGGSYLLQAGSEVHLRQLQAEIGRRFLGERCPLTAGQRRAAPPPPPVTYQSAGAKRRRLT